MGSNRLFQNPGNQQGKPVRRMGAGLGLDLLDQSRWTEEQTNHLTYVAITRARFRLYIPYLTDNPIVKKLLSCQ